MAENKTQIVISAKDDTHAAIKSAQSGLQQLSDQASKIGFGGFSAGLAALGGGAALTGLITSTISWAAAMDDAAERTGASVENLAGLARIAKISGSSLEEVEVGIIRLSKALAGADEEAKGAGHALAALKLDPEKLRAMDSADALKSVADAMGQFKDGTGKTALAMDLFGKSGAKLLPILNDISEAQEISGKLTGEQAAAAEQLEKAWRKMSSEGGGMAKSLVLDLLPAFASVLDVVQGAKIGIAQFGSSLAVLANDIMTAVQIIGVGLGAGFTEEGQAKISQLIEDRKRFTEAANQDMEERLGTYKSLRSEIEKTLSGGSASLPSLNYKSKDPKDAKAIKVKAEKELDPLDIAYGGYPGAYRDFVASIKRQADDAQAAADTDVQIEEAHQKRIMTVVQETSAFKLDVLQKELQDAAALMEEGAINADQWAEFAQVRIDAFNNVKNSGVDAFKELQQAIEGWGKSSADAFVEFAFTGKSSFSDMISSMMKDLAKMVVYQNITKPLSSGISEGISGGAFGDFFKGLFGGGRATGGPVNPGQYYVVGENGPEILVPNSSGTVIPNGGGSGGGSSSNVTINIDASGSKTEGDAGNARELGRRIESAVRSVLVVEKRPGGLLA